MRQFRFPNAIPPVETPLINLKTGMMTEPWRRYYEAMTIQAGGQGGDQAYEDAMRAAIQADENRASIDQVSQFVRGLEAQTGALLDEVRGAAAESLQEVRASQAQARAEAQSDLAVSVEQVTARLRGLEEGLRAEVQTALSALGELSKLDAAQRANIGLGAVGNQAEAFEASHAIRTLPAATPTGAASYNFKILRTPFFTVAPDSDITAWVSFQFRAPSDLFDWFFYKYALRLESEGGGTQTLISAPVATRRKGEWVSGSMAGANYDRVEPFALQFQLASSDISPTSSTGRYRIAFDLEPDNSVNPACAEGWGTTVTGTFAWQNISIQGYALNNGPIRS